MIGIVVVSHSPRLAQAAVDLALEMVHGEKPAIALAAGAGEGVTGTDAVKVAKAISEVSGPDGVLVMTDLGSAVLSAEMALDFLPETDLQVRLTSAPFVEGLIAGVVRAAAGATLDEVEREARGALAPKQSQLGQAGPDGAPPVPAEPGEMFEELILTNPEGLHARPAALVVAALSGLQARVTIANRRTGAAPADAASPVALLTIGGRKGDVIDVSASGPDAAQAVAAVRDLVIDGFGEIDEVPAGNPTPGLSGMATPMHAASLPDGGPMGVSPGCVIGPVVHMPEPLVEPAQAPPLARDLREREAERIAEAAAAVGSALRERAQRVSHEGHAILGAAAMFAADPALIQEAGKFVAQTGESAERAVWRAVTQSAARLSEQGGRAAERAADLHDLRNRIVSELLGRPAPGVPARSTPFVLVARDLAPADTALLDPATCRAIVTEEGGPTSHTAILARSLGIPAIVAASGAMDIAEGTTVLVDGTTGSIVVDPGPELLAAAAAGAEQETPPFNGTGRTADGHRISLLANVASPDSVADATSAVAEGVGLFRTEFCFLDREQAPSVDEQVTAYRRILTAFPGRKVVVRTLDAGADKPMAFVTASHEINPALGIRGFRTVRRRPELLEDQLRAIALAADAEHAEVGVMAPMIGTAEEAADFARRCAEHGLTNVGVMIETPSAALTAREILEVVDFVSLGTNDLAQYTMAADRLVGELATLNDPWQPAVLRLVALVGEAGATAGKPVGVCGESAADPLLAAVLAGLGVSSLSMSPRALAAVADRLGQLTYTQCKEAARLAVAAGSAAKARLAVSTYLGA